MICMVKWENLDWMTFLEIIRHPLTNLPIEQEKGSTFRNTVRNVLRSFGELIDSSDDLSEPINGNPFDSNTFKLRSKIIRDGILEAIDAYYEGNLNNAYNILSSFMKKSNLTGYLDKESFLPANTSLFRIRKAIGNYPLKRDDLFHIPFSARGKVKTQRYSIPGLPSLYLSNSVYVAWEELGRPGFNEVQAMRLANTRPIRLLDLTSEIYSRNEHIEGNTSYGYQLLYRVMVWPLLAACSIKVRNPDDSFKPEYIISQMLLQWVNKNLVDGIKYSSTHIDLRRQRHIGSFYNLVLPVKTLHLEEGYCTELAQLFTATQVLPMQLRQFTSFADRFHDQGSIQAHVNPNIQDVELIEGNPQPYFSTYFGILEHSLKHLELQPLC